MGVKLVSSGGGSVEINPPATASNFVATMPAGTGNVVVAGINSAIVSGTAVASTSGTSIDFTGIPSWVKRITVMFNGVSTNGTSNLLVRVGNSGGVISSGYACSVASSGATAEVDSTAGFIMTYVNAAASTQTGILELVNLESGVWLGQGQAVQGVTTFVWNFVGSVSSVGALDRVRITTVNGTDTFDAGSINILYE
jgi:hypothetical protein